MTKTICPNTEIALFSDDGLHWFDANTTESKRPIDWTANQHVTKIVIGTLESEGGHPKLISTQIPDNLDSLYPNLTHLYLWQIENLTYLPQLPAQLECLDVRGCEALSKLQELPRAVECLVLDDCHSVAAPPSSKLERLKELSLKNCINIAKGWIQDVLRSANGLKFFDASGCTQLVNLPQSPNAKSGTSSQWPNGLVDLRLNGCSNLEYLGALPQSLRRLELKDAASITELPCLENTIVDYLNLVNTSCLSAIPNLPIQRHKSGVARPRTLLLFRTGVKLERDLYGESEETNVATRYLSDLESSITGGREEDHELKVFLLGNGRCGKSSLARRWIHGEFRSDEKSTHGVRLWEKSIEFETMDGEQSNAKLNIWDFAGQDLYHSTHRLFLQSRAIFIICDTVHPPGADTPSDRREQAAIDREGEDVHRPVQYWLDQVKSLGKIPGLDSEPPVLVVHTKTDRGHQDNFGAIAFSAKTGEGLDVIDEWVRRQVQNSLGSFQERSLPKQAMSVKQELAPMIEANSKLYWEMDESNRTFQSPFPIFSRRKFDEIVKRHCTGGYAENPSELLNRFHRSGFLFYNAQYLENEIILDQRWVIQGIYAFASRQSDFNIREHLIATHGQFTAVQLSELSWDPAGFDSTAQKLFLSFMLACGMCFELLKHDESASNESVYAAPGFFPTRGKTILRSPEWFEDRVNETARYELRNVSEADMRSLIAKVGSDWSRSMLAWRWGCRIRSNRTGAECVLDWARPDDDANYTYPLVVRFSGPEDKSFEATLREIVSGCLKHAVYSSQAEFAQEWAEVKQEALDRESFPPDFEDVPELQSPSDKTRKIKRAVKPSRETAVGVRVTFSFAGSDDTFGLIGEIPTQAGAIVARWLDDQLLGEALCYNRLEGEERLEAFIQSLATGDIVVVFWSAKYWLSKYCMTEMMLIYKAPPLGALINKRVLVYAIDDKRLLSDEPQQTAEWKKHWVEAATTRDKKAHDAANGNIQEKTTLLKDEGIVHQWFDFVADRHEFEPFIKSLMQYRLSKPLSIPRNPAEAQTEAVKIANLIQEILQDPISVIDLAAQRLEQHRDDDAISLLFHALAMRPDQSQNLIDQLKSHKLAALPEKLRLLALDYLSDQNSR